MARAKREEQRIVRDQEIWEKRLLGWSQQQIADHLNVDQSLISRTLDRIEKRLHTEFVAQAEEVKARQTAQLEEVYRKALEQWERSCEDAEQVTTVTGLAKATEHGYVELPDRETRTVKGQSGNPALLAQALDALAAIRKIWGLDAAAKQEISGPEGGPMRVSEVVVELPRGVGE
jgi:DNA-binding MarR family transcriptional regulator